MMNGRRVVVVMPAYNAAQTLERTHAEVIEHEFVDHVIVVHVHPVNRGYGANQKTCYRAALDAGADVVVMVHPDYQYTPKLLGAMVGPIAWDVHDVMLGSRILGGRALAGGMPLYKYVANRALTLAENILLGAKLSEYHSGYRAYSRAVLESLPLEANSDDFVFDNEVLAEVLWRGFRIGEVSCPTKYFEEASSINFTRSLRYGFGCLGTGSAYRLAAWGVTRDRRFAPPRLGPRG